MTRLIPMEGRKVGGLEVLYRVENDAHGQARWRCRCQCGKEIEVKGGWLRREGFRHTCGCIQTRKITHDGRTQSIADWARELNWQPTTLRERIERMGVERALTAPRRSRKVFDATARAKVVRVCLAGGITLSEIGKAFGLTKSAMSRWCKSHEIPTAPPLGART